MTITSQPRMKIKGQVLTKTIDVSHTLTAIDMPPCKMTDFNVLPNILLCQCVLLRNGLKLSLRISSNCQFVTDLRGKR